MTVEEEIEDSLQVCREIEEFLKKNKPLPSPEEQLRGLESKPTAVFNEIDFILKQNQEQLARNKGGTPSSEAAGPAQEKPTAEKKVPEKKVPNKTMSENTAAAMPMQEKPAEKTPPAETFSAVDMIPVRDRENVLHLDNAGVSGTETGLTETEPTPTEKKTGREAKKRERLEEREREREEREKEKQEREERKKQEKEERKKEKAGKRDREKTLKKEKEKPQKQEKEKKPKGTKKAKKSKKPESPDSENSGVEEEYSERHPFLRTVCSILICALSALILAFLITTFVAHNTSVEGNSMNPTLSNGDQVIVEKVSYYFHEPERFDVVVFPFNDDTNFIKRVIGLPGEVVQIVDGEILINGVPLLENFGLEEMEDPGIAKEEVVLGEDEYFILGDNRNSSMDSRKEEVGPIKRSQIEGKAWFRFYPFKDFSAIS